ncbi:hypothetical protein CSKR_102744, partial [Clonorchis sinensis]
NPRSNHRAILLRKNPHLSQEWNMAANGCTLRFGFCSDYFCPELTDWKVRGSNPTPASRLVLSRFEQLVSAPALTLPLASVAAMVGECVTPERLLVFVVLFFIRLLHSTEFLCRPELIHNCWRYTSVAENVFAWRYTSAVDDCSHKQSLNLIRYYKPKTTSNRLRNTQRFAVDSDHGSGKNIHRGHIFPGILVCSDQASNVHHPGDVNITWVIGSQTFSGSKAPTQLDSEMSRSLSGQIVKYSSDYLSIG